MFNVIIGGIILINKSTNLKQQKTQFDSQLIETVLI